MAVPPTRCSLPRDAHGAHWSHLAVAATHGQAFLMQRRNCPIRKGFEVAAERQKERIALDAMPTTEAGVGGRKVGKMLSPEAELNPSWAVLRATFELNPAPILKALCELAGFEMPKRRVELDEVMDRVIRIGQEQERQRHDLEQIVALLASHAERKGPHRVDPEKRRAKTSRVA